MVAVAVGVAVGVGVAVVVAVVVAVGVYMSNTQVTPQAKMKATLERSGLKAQDIDVYGSQVVTACKGYPEAKKWAALLGEFCATVRAPRESWEDVRADAGKSRPRHYKVWRVWGTV